MAQAVSHNGAVLHRGHHLVVAAASSTAWSNMVTVPTPAGVAGTTTRVRVTAHVEGGPVLVSLADTTGADILCAEQEIAPGNVAVAELVAPSGGVGAILIRCGEQAAAPPRVTITAAEHAVVNRPHSALQLARVRSTEPGSAAARPWAARRVDAIVALTHTSRAWNLATCTRPFLAQRYAGDRSHALLAFSTLGPAGTKQYAGGLSILHVTCEGLRADVTELAHMTSDNKIQAADLVGNQLLLCLEDRLLAIDWTGVDARSGDSIEQAFAAAPSVIHDPWFAGLHTVVPVDDRIALVSASGPDAVMWVDVSAGVVTRRWRLPGDPYGRNYDLTPDDSVFDHYIHNDLQLGHLNSALPLGADAALISTLGQGDIGLVQADGSFVRLHHGSVGCHGVRVAGDGSVYFADSCSGQVRRLLPREAGEEWAWAESIWSAESQWLHDALEVGDGIYLLALGDRNAISLVDTHEEQELGRWTFDESGANVQFLSAISSERRRPAGDALSVRRSLRMD